MKTRLLAAGAMLLSLTAPALAQFPPPGYYICVDMDGRPFGQLILQVAGDYDFTSSDSVGGSGQLASSGQNVNAISGPLADIDLTGSFTTTADGAASFMFTTTMGSVLCGVPAQ